jgi:hypothetical protein
MELILAGIVYSNSVLPNETYPKWVAWHIAVVLQGSWAVNIIYKDAIWDLNLGVIMIFSMKDLVVVAFGVVD